MSERNVQWLQRQLEDVESKRDYYEHVAAGIRTHLEYLMGQSEAPEREDKASSRASAPVKEMRNAMWAILRDNGKPMHYKDIYRRLLANGVDVAGKDPARNVGAHLSNDDRFESLGGGRWGLVSWRNRTESAHHERRNTAAQQSTVDSIVRELAPSEPFRRAMRAVEPDDTELDDVPF